MYETSVFSGHKESGQPLEKLRRLLPASAEVAPRVQLLYSTEITRCAPALQRLKAPVTPPGSRKPKPSCPCQLQKELTGRLHRSLFREALVIAELCSSHRLPPQNLRMKKQRSRMFKQDIKEQDRRNLSDTSFNQGYVVTALFHRCKSAVSPAAMICCNSTKNKILAKEKKKNSPVVHTYFSAKASFELTSPVG